MLHCAPGCTVKPPASRPARFAPCKSKSCIMQPSRLVFSKKNIKINVLQVFVQDPFKKCSFLSSGLVVPIRLLWHTRTRPEASVVRAGSHWPCARPNPTVQGPDFARASDMFCAPSGCHRGHRVTTSCVIQVHRRNVKPGAMQVGTNRCLL